MEKEKEETLLKDLFPNDHDQYDWQSISPDHIHAQLASFSYFIIKLLSNFNNYDNALLSTFYKMDFKEAFRSFQNERADIFKQLYRSINSDIDYDIDIVQDLVKKANCKHLDIDIDVKLHIIDGIKLLVDKQNVCYHFNDHIPIGKLHNNSVIYY